ncbi:MAG: hypothetical protein ACPK85_08105 [Methanosarcina sp.]
MRKIVGFYARINTHNSDSFRRRAKKTIVACKGNLLCKPDRDCQEVFCKENYDLKHFSV